ncbi:MAG TPA: Rne/Rng family ribonuclease [Terrabacter sp.]|nr:Rne/Rng family ribonuclease [Terrabacter sp.]
MASNDTTTGDEATLFGGEQGSEAGGAPAADATETTQATEATGAPAPRRRASRRVTKKASAPTPSTSSTPESTTSPTTAPATELATASASEPATATGDEAGAGAAGATHSGDVEEQEAKRPARKRAARKKAEPAEGAPARGRTPRRGSRTKSERADAAVEELVADVLSGDGESVAAGAGTGSGDAAADATAVVDLDSLLEPRAAQETQETQPSVTADVSAEDEDEDAGEAQGSDTDQPTEPEGSAVDAEAPRPVVPSFSVLFQAPDASKAVPTRRRRGAQVEAVEATEEADESATADTGRTQRADEPEDAESRADQRTEELDEESGPRRSRRRRGGKGRRGRSNDEDDLQEQGSDSGDAREPKQSTGESRGSAGGGAQGEADHDADDDTEPDSDSDTESDDASGSSRRRRRRRRAGSAADSADDTPNVSVRVRQPRAQNDEPVAVKGSTRLEAKKQRRREGREAGRRRTIITEAEFLARREAVDRVMVVRNKEGRTQMGVLEDGVLVEHYIDQATNVSMAGNIYLGRVQNVLPSMEAAFVDIGKGRNAVLYAGEVNWDAAGLEANQPKRIEHALSSGQTVLVQVTKDPIGHKGARLTSQISLPGRYLVYVPNSSMTGISRKLPDTERARLKKILREVVPESAGVIVRTAAEGASEEELRADVERLTRTWEDIQAKAEAASSPRAGKSKGKKKNGGTGSANGGQAPMLLHGEPDLTVRVIRDVFNEDFKQLVVAGEQAWNEIHPYISSVAPDLADRVTKWTAEEDLFTHHRVDEQLAKAMDRKVWLPSGGSLVIDRTEAMTVVDVNTGKFVGSGGNLEETVTKNNIEAAEEIVRQLRLRDIGGIIVIDFIDMVLESNRELVVRRLLECLGRDRTKHQVAEVTSLGLVQMTRKRVGSGLIEVFSETCEHCNGRGFIIHTEPVDKGAHSHEASQPPAGTASRRRGRGQGGTGNGNGTANAGPSTPPAQAGAEPKGGGPTAAQIAAAAHAAALKSASGQPAGEAAAEAVAEVQAEAQAEVRATARADARPEAQSQPRSDSGSAHAFPEDTGPWSGDDAHATDPGDGQATQGGTHVELESDDAAPATPQTPEPTPEPTPEVAVESTGSAPVEAAIEVQPAARGRRRRGRVVAPAGPPRAHAGSGPEGQGPQAD